MKNNGFASFRDGHIGPSVILIVICLVATLLLAGTYQVTKPVIEEITIKNANAARAEVLPEADSFTQVTDVKIIDGVTEVYTADNGAGAVVTTACKGFGGSVVVMTGINANGEITAVKVTDAANETPGLGTKATTPEHLGKFVGASAVTNQEDGEGTRVDSITGATYTSNAVFNGVNAALQQFAELGGAL